MSHCIVKRTFTRNFSLFTKFPPTYFLIHSFPLTPHVLTREREPYETETWRFHQKKPHHHRYLLRAPSLNRLSAFSAVEQQPKSEQRLSYRATRRSPSLPPARGAAARWMLEDALVLPLCPQRSPGAALGAALSPSQGRKNTAGIA